MYIDLWDYKTWEEVPKELNDHQMGYISCTKLGTKVECGYCYKEIIIDGLESCPLCGKDLIYGRVDW